MKKFSELDPESNIFAQQRQFNFELIFCSLLLFSFDSDLVKKDSQIFLDAILKLKLEICFQESWLRFASVVESLILLISLVDLQKMFDEGTDSQFIHTVKLVIYLLQERQKNANFDLQIDPLNSQLEDV